MIFNTNLRNFLAVSSSKQRFKHAESITWSRTCKKFVRYSLLSRKFTIFLIKIWSRNISLSFLPCHLLIVFGYNTITRQTRPNYNKLSFSCTPCIYMLCYKRIGSCFSWAIELWMHLGGLESTQEARVALGCASSNSYASLITGTTLA